MVNGGNAKEGIILALKYESGIVGKFVKEISAGPEDKYFREFVVARLNDSKVRMFSSILLLESRFSISVLKTKSGFIFKSAIVRLLFYMLYILRIKKQKFNISNRLSVLNTYK